MNANIEHVWRPDELAHQGIHGIVYLYGRGTGAAATER